MKYGYFDDERKEYIITTPFTPLPWINYLGAEGFFSLISNTCGGYSFYRDAKLRRLTRYRYNEIPRDTGGRCFYIADGDTVWSPAYRPSGILPEGYRCRHGLGYSVFEGSVGGLRAELCCFVPDGENCEVQRLVLKNEDTHAKKLSVYAAVEWCLWDAVDDSTNFQRNFSTGEVESDGYAVYHKTEYRERRNHYAFYACNRPYDGVDTDRDAFLGPFNGWDKPETVARRTSRNSVASGWSPIAALRHDIELGPGDEFSLVYLLGYAENPKDKKFSAKGVLNKEVAERMRKAFDSDDKALAALKAVQDGWEARLSALRVRSSDVKFDRIVNIWNQYQCMVTFNLSRSASYFESGIGRGMGFRDSCQDLIGGIHLIPEDRARERILDLAAIQFEDGSTYHQYQPLTKTGNADIGQGFNDDPLWLIACTAAYLKETGDFSILEEKVPFNRVPGSEQPLFEHLKRSFRFTLTHKGPHGLPLIGRADWNDCLNLNCFSDRPGESFQTCSNFESGVAESVFIAGMFVYYGREYAEICVRTGRTEDAASAKEEVAAMEKAAVRFGWDGEWFLRAYDAFGGKVGSRECEEGQIYIEPQGFCAMAGIGGRDYGLRALRSVKERLLNEYGIEILAPCYTEYHRELGEVSSYPPGYKENGAVFCHNNPWMVFACAKLGDGETAFDFYRRTCPAYLEEVSDVHRTEPYVYSQMIAGRAAPRYGEAKNSWLTGTASWMMAAASQAILGIRPDYDGLRVEPCLPKKMQSLKIVRSFRGTEYRIEIDHRGRGGRKIFANGDLVSGAIRPNGKTIDVRVEM